MTKLVDELYLPAVAREADEGRRVGQPRLQLCAPIEETGGAPFHFEAVAVRQPPQRAPRVDLGCGGGGGRGVGWWEGSVAGRERRVVRPSIFLTSILDMALNWDEIRANRALARREAGRGVAVAGLGGGVKAHEERTDGHEE